MNQCPQVQVPLRKHRKSFFINPSTPGLSLVQSQVERCAGAMQSISAIAGTQQERRPHSHRLLQHGPLEQAQETRKTSMFSLQQQRWRSCTLFLIATSDTRYEREHDRRGGGDVAISFARSLFADSVSKTVNLALPYSLHVCSGCASHGIWRIALILVKVI